MKKHSFSTYIALLLISSIAFAADKPAATKPAPKAPTPTFADVPYGPHPHQIFDIYLPKSDKPTPVLIWFGGIWKAAKHAADPNRFLHAGVAVIGVEVRTMEDAQADKFNPPIQYVMDDATRIVQFIRLNAGKYNINPDRIALGGGSQGALPALYVGASADRANPKSDDPVLRVSSHVTCVAAYRCQPTIDPKRMQEWVPGVKWGAPSLGYTFEESLKRREELLPIINKWSPDALLHKDAAPMYFENEWGTTQPDDPKVTAENYRVHCPAWAIGFQKMALAAGAMCYLKYPGHPTEKYKDIWDFIVVELTQAGK